MAITGSDGGRNAAYAVEPRPDEWDNDDDIDTSTPENVTLDLIA